MSNEPTPSRRQVLCGQIASLYADLGWALPTSYEYGPLTGLEDTLGVALNAKESREAAAAGRGRAIDRHEDTICAVLDAVEYEGVSYADALAGVADRSGLTTQRLDQLVRCWCGIAGIQVPA